MNISVFSDQHMMQKHTLYKSLINCTKKWLVFCNRTSEVYGWQVTLGWWFLLIYFILSQDFTVEQLQALSPNQAAAFTTMQRSFMTEEQMAAIGKDVMNGEIFIYLCRG